MLDGFTRFNYKELGGYVSCMPPEKVPLGSAVTAKNVKFFPNSVRPRDGLTLVWSLPSGADPFPVLTIAAGCPTDTLTVGTPYTYTFGVSGGTLPYTFEIIDGALPDGLALDETTGVLSGTPTTDGTFAYTLQVTDSSDPAQSAVISCELVVETSVPSYEIATGLQFLIAEDQDDTYVYAGTNGFYVPAQVLRFLKSTGELVDTIDMPIQGTDSVCDLKSDADYLYARYSYSLLSVVRIRKSDFTVVDSISFPQKTANANPSLGQMWLDADEGKLYVPAENVGTGFATVWKIDLATFTTVGHLDLPNTPPGTSSTGSGIAGAITGDATDLYVGISNQRNIQAPSTLLYPALLFKVDKTLFTVSAVCFYPGIFSIEAALYPQLASDATHVYGFGPRVDFVTAGPVLYKFPKADITTATYVDLGAYTNSSYVDCLYIDSGLLYFQDDVSNDLMTLLLSDFVTTAVINSFAEQCSMFVFDATSYYEFMNGLAPDYSTLFKFPK